jgi:hypothetical protein
MTKRPPRTSPSGNTDRAREALIATIEKQIVEGTPKEVGGTLIRLCFLGYNRGEALRLIAVALTLDMREMMLQSRAYDEARYIAKLNALPQLAGEKGPGKRIQ